MELIISLAKIGKLVYWTLNRWCKSRDEIQQQWKLKHLLTNIFLIQSIDLIDFLFFNKFWLFDLKFTNSWFTLIHINGPKFDIVFISFILLEQKNIRSMELFLIVWCSVQFKYDFRLRCAFLTNAQRKTQIAINVKVFWRQSASTRKNNFEILFAHISFHLRQYFKCTVTSLFIYFELFNLSIFANEIECCEEKTVF